MDPLLGGSRLCGVSTKGPQPKGICYSGCPFGFAPLLWVLTMSAPPSTSGSTMIPGGPIWVSMSTYPWIGPKMCLFWTPILDPSRDGPWSNVMYGTYPHMLQWLPFGLPHAHLGLAPEARSEYVLQKGSN